MSMHVYVFAYAILSVMSAACAFVSGCFQFPDVVDFCERSANAGRIVIVAALDGTFQKQGIYCLPPNLVCLIGVIV